MIALRVVGIARQPRHSAQPGAADAGNGWFGNHGRFCSSLLEDAVAFHCDRKARKLRGRGCHSMKHSNGFVRVTEANKRQRKRRRHRLRNIA